MKRNQLSSEALAVLNAAEESNECYNEFHGQIAAALRAAVDEYQKDPCGESMSYFLLSIASELEANPWG